MKVLVVGGGGREHALVWKIAQSPLVDKLYCAPGNPGIAEHAECINIHPEDTKGLLNFASDEKIDITVVGPEAPLAKGIVNAFKSSKLKIFGPVKESAILEASKVYCKKILRKYSIPAPSFAVFDNSSSAFRYLEKAGYPVVVKADGLAGGKGSIVCRNINDAKDAVRNILDKKIFGDAGRYILIEEFLTGKEVSFFGFVDSKGNILSMEPVQDFKRAYNNDRGPNTGGMGSYSPPMFWNKNLLEEACEILAQTVYAMKREGKTFYGMLYAGLMATANGLKVLEFNVRFGDPETQAMVVRLKSDLLKLILATVDKTLDKEIIRWSSEPSVCVVMASKGYPGSYTTGFEIKGTEDAQKLGSVQIFHAGTKLKNKTLVNSGGRVLGITATGKDIKEARARAYKAVEMIKFKGAFYRTDIAKIKD